MERRGVGTKLSDLNAYLQGVQTRLQIVIATNALLLTATGLLIASFRPQTERLPFPATLVMVVAGVCLARAIFIAATLAGLYPRLRHLLIDRFKVTGETGY